jgi:hypothetical protein
MWRITGQLKKDDVHPEEHQFPMRIVGWGEIARNDTSPLIRVEGILNADRDIQLVTESDIIEIMNSQFGSNALVFEDDQASVHRAKMAFLAQNRLTFSTYLHCPAHNPD